MAGALRHGHTAAGGHQSPTYVSWQRMKARCLQPKSAGFEKYGGAGVTVCERWRESFENFLADMGERPAGTTLNRIDNSQGYEPGNCNWATATEQNRNRGFNVYVDLNGERVLLAEAAARLGIKYHTAYMRLKRNGQLTRKGR